MLKSPPLKARSRLKHSHGKNWASPHELWVKLQTAVTSPSLTSSAVPSASGLTMQKSRATSSSASLLSWAEARRWQISIAVLSLIAIILLLTTVSPAKVADIFLSESYLPLVLLVAMCTYFTARLWLARRHATYLSLTATLLVFSRVHSLTIPTIYLVFPVICILCIELTVLLAKKR